MDTLLTGTRGWKSVSKTARLHGLAAVVVLQQHLMAFFSCNATNDAFRVHSLRGVIDALKREGFDVTLHGEHIE